MVGVRGLQSQYSGSWGKNLDLNSPVGAWLTVALCQGGEADPLEGVSM